MADHLSFGLSRASIKGRILIPKYYDPELLEAEELASGEYELPTLGELLEPGTAGSRLGCWIRREHYGSGPIPYVRTSDFNDWRIRPDFKKGVSAEVHASFTEKHEVCAGDLLMVAHGTYLIGTVSIVTEEDLPLLLQDHVFRLRLSKKAGIDSHLLLAALSTRFVKRQIRAKQFSADIIDKIGNRHLEVRVPIPKDPKKRRDVADAVRSIVSEQSEIRRGLTELLASDRRMGRERAATRHAFPVSLGDIANRIFIPKYYDPVLRDDLAAEEAAGGASWVAISYLIETKRLSLATGIEVGKMAYGTGTIPFIRTTDIADLEVKADPRQGVSQDIYGAAEGKGSLSGGDILVVRDGTYLVGSSALVTDNDVPALYCGGIFRLRSTDADSLDPNVLLGLLNMPIVRRQMRAKQFTRDVIDTLGKRFLEVRLPDPASEVASRMGKALTLIMSAKADIRKRIKMAINAVEPAVPIKSKTRPGWSMRG